MITAYVATILVLIAATAATAVMAYGAGHQRGVEAEQRRRRAELLSYVDRIGGAKTHVVTTTPKPRLSQIDGWDGIRPHRWWAGHMDQGRWR